MEVWVTWLAVSVFGASAGALGRVSGSCAGGVTRGAGESPTLPIAISRPPPGSYAGHRPADSRSGHRHFHHLVHVRVVAEVVVDPGEGHVPVRPDDVGRPQEFRVLAEG